MFIKNKYASVSDDTKLWRYLSLSKFMDLLDTSALYFRRIDCFEDQLEATQPDGASFFAKTTENPWQLYELLCVDKQLNIYKNMTFANCWHINDRDNPDMWHTYVMSHGNEGVAIQTCFRNLADSFNTDRVLTNLKMKYIDYHTCFLDYSFPNYPEYLSIKDKQFEYENELRIITLEKEYPQFDADLMGMDYNKQINTHKGEHIKIELQTLIQSIYLSPNSTLRFREHIEQLLLKHNIDVPIFKSI